MPLKYKIETLKAYDSSDEKPSYFECSASAQVPSDSKATETSNTKPVRNLIKPEESKVPSSRIYSPIKDYGSQTLRKFHEPRGFTRRYKKVVATEEISRYDDSTLDSLKSYVSAEDLSTLVDENLTLAKDFNFNDAKRSISQNIDSSRRSTASSNVFSNNENKNSTPKSSINILPVNKNSEYLGQNLSSMHKITHFYYYTSVDRYMEILKNRHVELEKILIGNEVHGAIVLLTTSPKTDSMKILRDLYGTHVPIDPKRIECCIKFTKEFLLKLNPKILPASLDKYFFYTPISFDFNNFPQHEIRFEYICNRDKNKTKFGLC